MTIRGSGSTSCQSWRRSTRGDPRQTGQRAARRGHQLPSARQRRLDWRADVRDYVAREAYRRETGWVSSQGGPGVFAGDLYYYSYDHDLAGGNAGKIDTSKVGD